MKVEFYGAAKTVTGSCHILTVKDKTILLDCGLYQGKKSEEKGNEIFAFNPKDIDYVILSHAHIDHSGRIPLLYKQGFRGRVLCTDATKDLCVAMLRDSGHIQEFEVEWKNIKRMRRGEELLEPLYTMQDALQCISLFTGYKYDQEIQVFDGLKVVFRDAGHLLGASSLELHIKEEEKEIILVYSGDVGNKNLPLIKNPTQVKYADYVIMETTYGDRLHKEIKDEVKQLVDIARDTFRRGGNVIIPSFAVGRAQEIIFELNKYIESGQLNNCRVYLDSPLAVEATGIFKKYMHYFNDEALRYMAEGDDPLEFPGLTFTKSKDESAELNKVKSGAIIISASGMCEAGRIKHHLKHNLWRKESSIVFVGYQVEGSLGRLILDGAKKVKIFGEEIVVNAKIYELDGLSGHADRDGLFEWITGFKKKPQKVFLVHGDPEALFSFKELLDGESLDSEIMANGQIVELSKDHEVELCNKDKLKNLINAIDINSMTKEEILNYIKKEL